MMRWLLLPLALMLLLVALLIAGWFYSVQRLTQEEPLVEIQFRQIAPQQHMATLRGHNGCQWGQYELLGDQWRIDAQFIKWKPFATLLGLDARYRLERLSGRYSSVAEANRKPHRVYHLGEQSALDLVSISQSLGPYNLLLDAEYGSSTYQSIDTLKTYTVYRTQSGLIARSTPRELPRYQDGNLTIRINRSCDQKIDLWQRAALASNQWFRKLTHVDQ
ncbi:hypothetical protein MIB92_05260 [Aestuariirhabdus sp. Z084]|uniref:hypothetical protein n=1 Tax=Aestuariirhabdus haliotis TaxID=2918751 RepID=UPI00201B437E|nr:hypothetical protein [Aestuariirhabdus haliotis]MCL6415049.1 hypothetical protein [Aestuariirhabdus haliotis]MCL6418981.1 hypothetical protein [Aestuariirhabdus haliotis]